jgi:hypothetical protein
MTVDARGVIPRSYSLINSILRRQLGRITYLLTSLLIALAGGIALRVLHSHPDSEHLPLAVHGGLVVLGIFWIRSLEQRLKDAGLPRWSFWPYLLVVMAVCFGAQARHVADWPRLMALFVLLQAPAFLLQDKLASRGCGGYLRPVGRYLFFLRILLMVAFGAAFFHMALRAGPGVERWEMALGLVLLGFAWIYNVEGRVLDAGLPGWAPTAFCTFAPGICLIVLLSHLAGIHVALWLFVGLNSSMAGFDRGHNVEGLAQSKAWPLLDAGPLGGFEFAVYLFLIAGLWAVLHLLRGDVAGPSYACVWQIAFDTGSLCLCFGWVASVRRRTKSLGLARWYFDFCFGVLLVCILPVAYRILTFPCAIILFIALQIPVIFLRKDLIPAKFFSFFGES